MNYNNQNMDEGLRDNQKIEAAITALQKDPSEEMLAHTLTVIRRRMREDGQLVIAVEPPEAGDDRLRIEVMQTGDGKKWWLAFTSFEEELKGGGSVKSTFLADIDRLFQLAVDADGLNGIIINPWNKTIMLDKALLNIILGNDTE